MKKLINDPRQPVRELLEGTIDLSPGLALLEGENVVVCRDLPLPAERKVAVLSGGGSGHEPAHAGYVGRGMLTAAAEAGAEATSAMFPALGRASYLGDRAIGTPDGGAVAVSIWRRALARGIAE